MNKDNTYTSQNQAAQLFALIFGQCPDGFLEVRAFHWDKARQPFFSIPSEIAGAIRFAVSLQEEVFFGVGVRFEPLAIVDSGHPLRTHFHAYYGLTVPYDLISEASRVRASAFLKALRTAFNGDYKSCDLARVLRVPGMTNTKAGRLCTLMETNQTARYSIEQIRDAITNSIVARHWQKGQRHDLALSLAGYLATRQVP